MNAGDILMKKWCFGTGRSKAREEGAMNRPIEPIQSIALSFLRWIPQAKTVRRGRLKASSLLL